MKTVHIIRTLFTNIFTCFFTCVILREMRKFERTTTPSVLLHNNIKTMLVTRDHTVKNLALRYDRSLETGFGDRISVYMCVAAAAAAVNRSVYVWWHECIPNQDHHSELCLEEIKDKIVWPSNLHVLTKKEFYTQTLNFSDIIYNSPSLLASASGFDGVYTTAWKTLRLPGGLAQPSKESFEKYYRQVCGQLKFNGIEIHEILKKPYTVLHIRGGDKQIRAAEFNTKIVLNQLPSGTNVLLITDDIAYSNDIIARYTKNGTDNSLHIEQMSKASLPSEKHKKILRDFVVLMGAQQIIQHSPNAWSAFSNSASMMAGIPLINTWIKKESKFENYVGRLYSFHQAENCPREFFSSNTQDGINRFIQTTTNYSRSINTDWVIVVTVSVGYNEMFLNWLYWYNKLGIDNKLIVIAEDNQTFQKYNNCSKFTTVWTDLQLSSNAFSYRSPEYNILVSKRPRQLQKIMALHGNIIYTDIDTIWQKDPQPYLMGDFDVSAYGDTKNELCTGFLAIKSTEKTDELLKSWSTLLQIPQTNQRVFNDLLVSHNISVHTLDNQLFTPGNLYFDSEKIKLNGLVLIHNNWIIGIENKIQRFKSHGLWNTSCVSYCCKTPQKSL